MTLNKDSILTALPKLTRADLLALQAVIGGLLSEGPAAPQVMANSPQAWLYEAMAAVLNSRQSYTSFSASAAAKQFSKHAPVALGFVNGTFGGVMGSKAKAMGVMRYLLGLLAADMKAQKIPVTRNTMAQHLPRLPEVFEGAFPSYAQAGVASLITIALCGKS